MRSTPTSSRRSPSRSPRTTCCSEPDEKTAGGTDLALIENLNRVNVTPLDQARGVQRLLQQGRLSRKGIAERLGKPQSWVRERLAIFALPQALHPLVDAGTVPLKAVKPLAQLADPHPDLAVAAANVILADTPAVDARAHHVGHARRRSHRVRLHRNRRPARRDFALGGEYFISQFALTSDTDAQLDELVSLRKLVGLPDSQREDIVVYIDDGMRELTVQLGAGARSKDGTSGLIYAQDVVNQLASDWIAKFLADVRTEAAARAERADHTGADTNRSRFRAHSARRPSRRRGRRARAAPRRARRRLGSAADRRGVQRQGRRGDRQGIRSHQLDDRVVKILTALDLKNDVEDMAARGARYAFPGWWATEPSGKSATKRVYLERYDTRAKTHAYLAGANTPGEYAGRCLALAVAAMIVDDACVARTNRIRFSWYSYGRSGFPGYGGPAADEPMPWRTDVADLVEDLAIEQLPDHLTETLRARRAKEQREEAERLEAERGDQTADELRAQIPAMTADERSAAIDAYRAEHGRVNQAELRTLARELD